VPQGSRAKQEDLPDQPDMQSAIRLPAGGDDTSMVEATRRSCHELSEENERRKRNAQRGRRYTLLTQEDVEDALQEAEVQCLQARRRRHCPLSESYQRTVVKHSLDQQHRSARARAARELPLEATQEELCASGWGASPEKEAALRILTAAIHEAMNELPYAQRDVAEAVLLSDVSIAEYARARGLRHSTARSRFGAALLRLHRNMLARARGNPGLRLALETLHVATAGEDET
jgi:DNA-directed RNA polymerase specialized sigma24 family protein